jgi:hypothetical protein
MYEALKKMFSNENALLDSLAVLRVEQCETLCKEIIEGYHSQTDPLDELDKQDLEEAQLDVEACQRVIRMLRVVE